MKKFFVIILFFATVLSSAAQDGYIVKLDISLVTDECNFCSANSSIRYILIKNLTTSEEYLSIGPFSYMSDFSNSYWISCSVGDKINVSGIGHTVSM